MRPNGFVLLVAGAATMLPLPATAQQPALPIVGILNSTTSGLRPEQEVAFRRGLGELGYVEGKNFKLEYRIANDQYDRLPALALELINLKVAVIVAAGGPITAIASRKVTTTVPVVFTTIADPVKAGLVESLKSTRRQRNWNRRIHVGARPETAGTAPSDQADRPARGSGQPEQTRRQVSAGGCQRRWAGDRAGACRRSCRNGE